MNTFIKNFFTKNIDNYQLSDIEKIQKIEKSYSNNIFCLQTFDKKKFFIRIVKKNDFINRNNEMNYFLKSIDNKPLFIDQFGNMISNWIDNFLDIENFNKSEINLIIEKILLISKLEVENFNNFDYFKYLKKNNKIANIYIDKYKEIIKKYEKEKLVFAHNDLNLSNIYFYNEKVEFIDWEWCSMNNNYWDIAYFLKDLNLDEDLLFYISNQFSLFLNKIYDFLFITIIYTISWIEFYKIKKLNEYYKHLNNILNLVWNKF